MIDIISGIRNAFADTYRLLKGDHDKTVAQISATTKAVQSVPGPIVQAVNSLAVNQKTALNGVELRIEKLIQTINGKDNAVSMENVDEITGELRSGLNAVIDTLKEEIGKMDKQIVVKNDLGQLLSLFKGNKDKGDLLKALAKVESAIEDIEFPKMVDYTSALKDLSKVVESKTTKKLEELLTAISKKEYPDSMRVVLEPRLIDDDRLRVILSKDQMTSLTTTLVAGSNSLPIVEELRRQGTKYALRLVEAAPYTYIGKALPGANNSDAVWQIFRMDETTGLDIEWADGDSSFNNIWANYATLSYS